MLELKGLNGESLILDGEWLEKLRGGSTSVARIPISRYQNATLESTTTKKFVFFGDKTEVLIVTIQAGMFMGIQLPGEKKAEAEGFIAALRKAAEASTRS
jgi:hypothetical protein